MVYCSQCAEELPEKAYFCLKCGTRTQKGVEAGVSPPWNWEKQLEQIFSTVTKEMEKQLIVFEKALINQLKKLQSHVLVVVKRIRVQLNTAITVDQNLSR